ncbi:MAG: peptidyl-prolyl cis-trans isomerase [Candidatus Omnitrophica bacterium]|nr:peptidyl-prolyl cis-trans isomerase [Candidatus Omnitrophota bacterium]
MPRLLIFCFLVVSLTIVSGEEKKQGKVVASIGSENISLQEVDEEFNQFGRSGFFPGAGGNNEMKKRLLDQIVRERLFLKAAKEAKVTLTSQEERQIEKMRALLIIRKYVEEELKKKPITEEEMKSYYQANQSQFTTKEQRKIARIQVKEEKQAEEILKKLKEGADFATLARENGTDAVAKRGGELGWLAKEGLPEPLREVAFRLNKGENSAVITTPEGWTILKVEDIKPAEVRPFEKVSAEIRRKLEQERIKEIENKLKEQYQVKVDYTALESSGTQ